MFVDGKLLIDDWKLVRAMQPNVAIDLPAGPHKVVVEEWQKSVIGGHLLFAITPVRDLVRPEALRLAKAADVVVIAAGFQQESESEGGDRTFALPFGQAELIRAVAAINPKTVVAVTSGGNVDSNGWLDQVPALIETWYGGQTGGQALSEVLFGDVNPSGHLPVTFERRLVDNPAYATYYPAAGSRAVHYTEGIFVGYRGYEKTGTEPLFPFGYGMSYTTFKFSNLKVQQSKVDGETSATATFDVTNTGTRTGADVAQLYVGESAPKVPRPMHELKGFERVELTPGETRHMQIPLDARSFQYWDTASSQWVIGTSRFTVWVGDSVANLPLKSVLELKGVGR